MQKPLNSCFQRPLQRRRVWVGGPFSEGLPIAPENRDSPPVDVTLAGSRAEPKVGLRGFFMDL